MHRPLAAAAHVGGPEATDLVSLPASARFHAPDLAPTSIARRKAFRVAPGAGLRLVPLVAGRRSRRTALLTDGAKMLVDASAAVVASIVAAVARWGTLNTPALEWLSGGGLLLLAVAWSFSLGAVGAYQRKLVGNLAEENRRIARAAIYFGGGLCITLFALNSEISRVFAAVTTILALVLTLAARYLLHNVVRRIYTSGYAMSGVVLVGMGESVPEMAERLISASDSGFKVVGACLPSDGVDADVRDRLSALGVPVLGTPSQIINVVAEHNAQAVVVTAPAEFGAAAVRAMAWELEPTDAEFMVSTGLEQVSGHRVRVRQAGRAGLLQIDQPMYAGAKRVLKGVTDRAIATVALIGLLPMLITVAVMVRLDSKGSPLYIHTRIGKDGKPFRMVKFRSMYADNAELRQAQVEMAAEKAQLALQDLGRPITEVDRGPMFKDPEDPRITKIGRFMRKTSVDELPQLLNVIVGSMSLVGPRPALAKEVAEYEEHDLRRLKVKPGMTGLWQVSGRSDLNWTETVRLDLHYVENWTTWLDLSIIARTFKAVFRSQGAY